MLETSSHEIYLPSLSIPRSIFSCRDLRPFKCDMDPCSRNVQPSGPCLALDSHICPCTACRYVSGDYDYAVCEYDVNFSPYVVGSLSPSILTH